MAVEYAASVEFAASASEEASMEFVVVMFNVGFVSVLSEFDFVVFE